MEVLLVFLWLQGSSETFPKPQVASACFSCSPNLRLKLIRLNHLLWRLIIYSAKFFKYSVNHKIKIPGSLSTVVQNYFNPNKWICSWTLRLMRTSQLSDNFHPYVWGCQLDMSPGLFFIFRRIRVVMMVSFWGCVETFLPRNPLSYFDYPSYCGAPYWGIRTMGTTVQGHGRPTRLPDLIRTGKRST